MTDATMYEDLRLANRETFRKIINANGSSILYFTDNRGREFYSLFGTRNQFQGTYPIYRRKEPSP